MKDCNACGKCCIKYSNGGLSASNTEIEQWQESNPEIHAYVNNGKIWMDPDTGKQLELCPFLDKQSDNNGRRFYTCRIYFNRPDDCRYYPSTLDEMIADDCEMIEAKDLKNPKKARQALELIMSDSRY